MADKLCKHGRKLCSECQHVTDSAKRARDIIAGYVAFIPYEQRIRSWVALRLADGGSDGNLYDSKVEAVRHQPDEFMCAYFSYRGAPNGFASLKDAAVWMEYHRQAYDAGIRTPDPDAATGGPELIMPTPNEHVKLQLDQWHGVN